MEKKNTWIIIGALVVLLIGNQLGLFSVFTPESEKLVQYAVFNQGNPEFLDYIKGSSFSQPSNINNKNTNPLVNTLVADIVTINSGKNEFEFITTSIEVVSGQLCTQSVSVYKNGNLIDSFEKYDSNGVTTNRYLEEIYYDGSSQDSYVVFKTIFQPYFTGCDFAVNSYSIQLSDDSFDFNIYTPTTTFIEGQDVIVYAEIDNKLTQTYLADVELTFKTPTLFGFAEKTIVENDVILNPGVNTIELTLTPQSSSGSIEITPKLNLKVSGNSLNGLNYGNSNTEYYKPNQDPFQCSGNNMIPFCGWHSPVKKKITSNDWIPFGTIEGDMQLISVSPNPLYLPLEGSSCLSGYILSYNGEYCIRDDIGNLGCAILGCPSVPDHDYFCTSSGICAEVVYVDKSCEVNEDCPDDTTCEINSGLCIKTEIYTEFIQKDCESNSDCPSSYECDSSTGLCFKNIYLETSCESNSDCPSSYECDSSTGLCFKENTITLQCIQNNDCLVPCNGITANCNVVGQCVYSGECNQVEIGCTTLGCPVDYDCNTQLNVCVSSSSSSSSSSSGGGTPSFSLDYVLIKIGDFELTILYALLIFAGLMVFSFVKK